MTTISIWFSEESIFGNKIKQFHGVSKIGVENGWLSFFSNNDILHSYHKDEVERVKVFTRIGV
jgi:hypothetical protein